MHADAEAAGTCETKQGKHINLGFVSSMEKLAEELADEATGGGGGGGGRSGEGLNRGDDDSSGDSSGLSIGAVAVMCACTSVVTAIAMLLIVPATVSTADKQADFTVRVGKQQETTRGNAEERRGLISNDVGADEDGDDGQTI